MDETRTVTQDSAEDLFFGQVVVNWARWFVIGAGVLLVIWTVDEVNKLAIGIIPVVALMATNFYLPGRHIARRPANRTLMTVAGVLDLAAITAVVLFWPEADQKGLASPFFVMYYPVVLAFAFIMPPKSSVAYTVVTLVTYAAACLLAATTSVTDIDAVKSFVGNADFENLVTRLITLGAMGGLGTYYWRIQRRRRHAPSEDTALTGDHPES